MLGEHQLQIPPGLDIIAPQPRQILDQHNLEPVLLHITEHILKARTVKAGTRPSVVHVLPYNGKPFPLCICLQQAALVLDALAFSGIIVVVAQPQVQNRPAGSRFVLYDCLPFPIATCKHSSWPMTVFGLLLPQTAPL